MFLCLAFVLERDFLGANAMSNIGCVPQRETLRLSLDGAHTIITKATEASAGCMSAEQARQVNLLWRAHETQGGNVVITAPMPTENLVTHQQLSTALKALPQMQHVIEHHRPTELTASDPRTTQRVETLEREVASVRDRPLSDPKTTENLLAIIEAMSIKIEALEKRIEICEQIENNLGQGIDALGIAVVIGFEAEKIRSDKKPTPEKYPAFAQHFKLTALDAVSCWHACVENYEIKTAA